MHVTIDCAKIALKATRNHSAPRGRAIIEAQDFARVTAKPVPKGSNRLRTRKKIVARCNSDKSDSDDSGSEPQVCTGCLCNKFSTNSLSL